MKNFKLLISTPEGCLYKGDAVKVSLRGADGDLAVLAGHTPLVTTVKAGECHIWTDSESGFFGQTDGGLLTVSADGVTLLCGKFEKEE